jgi:hypothetical protein
VPERVTADRVPGVGHTSSESRVSFDPAADHEERRGNPMGGEPVENHGRVFRKRSVVEGEVDARASAASAREEAVIEGGAKVAGHGGLPGTIEERMRVCNPGAGAVQPNVRAWDTRMSASRPRRWSRGVHRGSSTPNRPLVDDQTAKKVETA